RAFEEARPQGPDRRRVEGPEELPRTNPLFSGGCGCTGERPSHLHDSASRESVEAELPYLPCETGETSAAARVPEPGTRAWRREPACSAGLVSVRQTTVNLRRFRPTRRAWRWRLCWAGRPA